MSPEAGLTCKWTALHPLFVGSKSSSASHDGTAKNTMQMFPLSNHMCRKQQVSINSLLNTRFRVNLIPRELNCDEDIIHNESLPCPTTCGGHELPSIFRQSQDDDSKWIPKTVWLSLNRKTVMKKSSIDSEELYLLHCRRRWGQRNNTWQGVPGWASRRWRIARHKSRPLSRASSISPQTCFERRRETTQRGLRRPLRSFGTRVWGGQLRMPFESAARQPSINHKQSNLTHLSACESNPYNRSWKLSVPSKTFTNSTFNPSFLRCSSHARIELHHPN